MTRFLLLFSNDVAELADLGAEELKMTKDITDVITEAVKSKYAFMKVIWFSGGEMHDLGTADLGVMKHEREKDNVSLR